VTVCLCNSRLHQSYVSETASWWTMTWNGQDGRRQRTGDRGPVHLDLNRDLALKRASNGLKIRNIVSLHVRSVIQDPFVPWLRDQLQRLERPDRRPQGRRFSMVCDILLHLVYLSVSTPG
jgi:hypothetical protein